MHALFWGTIDDHVAGRGRPAGVGVFSCFSRSLSGRVGPRSKGKSLPDAPPLWLALRGSFGEAVEPYSSSIKRVGLQRTV